VSLAALFHYLCNVTGIPAAKLFDYNISVCIGELRHVTEILKGPEPASFLGLMPVECALFPEIDISDQQNSYVEHHLHEAETCHCLPGADHILEDVRPGVQKDRFHVEQNEHHRHQVKFYRERFARVPRWGHATLIGLLLKLVRPAPPDKRRNC